MSFLPATTCPGAGKAEIALSFWKPAWASANFLATWHAWQADPLRSRRLHFVSYEKHPFSAADLAVAQRAWPEFSALAAQLQQQWPVLTPGVHRLYFAQRQVVLTLFFGDASHLLRATDAAVDAFYLDGFSPAKNPDLWSDNVCKAISRLAAPGATGPWWSRALKLRAAGRSAQTPWLCRQTRDALRPFRLAPPDATTAWRTPSGVSVPASRLHLPPWPPPAGKWTFTTRRRRRPPARPAIWPGCCAPCPVPMTTISPASPALVFLPPAPCSPNCRQLAGRRAGSCTWRAKPCTQQRSSGWWTTCSSPLNCCSFSTATRPANCSVGRSISAAGGFPVAAG